MSVTIKHPRCYRAGRTPKYRTANVSNVWSCFQLRVLANSTQDSQGNALIDPPVGRKLMIDEIHENQEQFIFSRLRPVSSTVSEITNAFALIALELGSIDPNHPTSETSCVRFMMLCMRSLLLTRGKARRTTFANCSVSR